MTEGTLSKQKNTNSRRSLGHKHSTLGRSRKVHPVNDESIINIPSNSTDTSPQKLLNGTAKNPSRSAAVSPTDQASKPGDAVVLAVHTEQQNLPTTTETPPLNTFDVPTIVPTPGHVLPHATGDTHTDELPKSSEVVVSALSVEQQNIWNKAKQVLEE